MAAQSSRASYRLSPTTQTAPPPSSPPVLLTVSRLLATPRRQARIESVTEALSALLESGEPDKLKILNTAADARLRLKHMREGLEEGLTIVQPPAPPPRSGAGGLGRGVSASDPICLE